MSFCFYYIVLQFTFVVLNNQSVFGYNNALSSLHMMGGGVVRGDRIPLLIQLVEKSKSNKNVIFDSSNNNRDIIFLMNDISKQNVEFADIKKVNGIWEVLWTTSPNLLSSLRNAQNVVKIIETVDLDETKSFQTNLLITTEAQVQQQKIIDYFQVLPDKIERLRINLFAKTNENVSNTFMQLFRVGNISNIQWIDILYVNNVYKFTKNNKGYYVISRKMK